MRARVKKMKHKKILKKPNIHIKLRKDKPEVKMDQAIQSLPRITNETVAAHREELLSSARKYIYPLKHTKHRVVVISSWIFGAALVFFFAYTGFSLYKFQSTSTFLYYVTQVIPLPVAKAGPNYVSYENYLFELRHYMHYYQTQQQVNFNSATGKRQLDAFKKEALQEVINDAYVKQLAAQNHVSVSNEDVNNEVQLVRQQNRLGSSNQEFADVLSEFWGWSINDFKRELKSQLLAQKVVATLDTSTNSLAQSVLVQLQKGASFSKLAKKYSQDTTTSADGGQYGALIDSTDQNLSPQVVNALVNLKPGQTSGIINTGYTLEIDKVLSVQDGKIKAAHIVFNLKSINTYIQPLALKEKSHAYIHV